MMGNLEKEKNQYLGSGIAYPFQMKDGCLVTNSLEERVRQSILIILKTEKNERPMLPDFGAGLSRYVFTGMYHASVLLLKRSVFEALEKYEPRISILNIEVLTENEEASVLNIHIEYRIKSNGSVHNLVYPYYAGGGRGDI